MSALEHLGDRTGPLAAFQEAMMSAAAQLAATSATQAASAPSPVGVPVRRGRLSVGRVRAWLPVDGSVRVLAGFGTACWLGGADEQSPDLGRLVCRSEGRLDGQARLVLDRRVRAWLGVSDANLFHAVLMPAASGGVLLVPSEGFMVRTEAVAA